MTFELLVAVRYLRAKRQTAMISVITIIAVLGVAAGVAALVVAMAMNEGQRQDFRDRLLGIQPHVKIYAARGGVSDYLAVAKKVKEVPGVVNAAPYIDRPMAIERAGQLTLINVSGVIPDQDESVARLSRNVTA